MDGCNTIYSVNMAAVAEFLLAVSLLHGELWHLEMCKRAGCTGYSRIFQAPRKHSGSMSL